jgi:hypothetical protein
MADARYEMPRLVGLYDFLYANDSALGTGWGFHCGLKWGERYLPRHGPGWGGKRPETSG